MNYESRIMNKGRLKTIIHNSLFMIHSKGFTLVELLIVIAILGILGGGIIAAINPLAKINSANLAKAKTFAASVENGLAFDQVGKWSFDDSSDPGKDTSGYKNDGTLVNSPTWTTAATCGLGFGGCLRFDGGNGYVRRASGTSLPLGNSPRTFEAWIKPFSYPDPTYNGIVAYGQRTCFNGSLLSIRNDGRLSMAFWCNDAYQTTGPTAILNEWNHVAFTYEGGTTVKFYMNGKFVQESSLSAGVLPTTEDGPIRIGSTDDPGRNFNGLIDEVKIYNQALFASQIQQLYARGLPKHSIAYAK